MCACARGVCARTRVCVRAHMCVCAHTRAIDRQRAIEAASDGVILFGHAEPIGEPVVAHGPFVMTTREEIQQAIRDYQEGRFDAPAAQSG